MEIKELKYLIQVLEVIYYLPNKVNKDTFYSVNPKMYEFFETRCVVNRPFKTAPDVPEVIKNKKGFFSLSRKGIIKLDYLRERLSEQEHRKDQKRINWLIALTGSTLAITTSFKFVSEQDYIVGFPEFAGIVVTLILTMLTIMIIVEVFSFVKEISNKLNK